MRIALRSGNCPMSFHVVTESNRGNNDELIQSKLFHPRCKRSLSGGLQRSRHSVAAVVRGRSLADFHPIFRATADNAVGAAQLECRVCSDQFAAIMASLHRASSSQTDTGGGGHSTARFPGLTSSQSPPGSEHWIQIGRASCRERELVQV